MIQRNNNLSILPFYDSIDEQDSRRSYAYGDIYPLYTPMGAVPPFQIIFPHDVATNITVWKLMREDGTLVRDISTDLQNRGLTRVNFTDYDIILYPSNAPHNITHDEGRYYIEGTFTNGKKVYSDVFTVVGDMKGFLWLQWYDSEDFVMDGCRIAYKKDGEIVYRNVLWLNAQLGKPDYEFDEEGESRDGYFFPEKMISTKRYKFTILASEYLCDVMRFIRLSDFVWIKDMYGNRYRCDTFLITPKWEVQGNLASVEVEFTCDTVAKKIAHGYADFGMHGDYNNDYNNDYDIDET